MARALSTTYSSGYVMHPHTHAAHQLLFASTGAMTAVPLASSIDTKKPVAWLEPSEEVAVTSMAAATVTAAICWTRETSPELRVSAACHLARTLLHRSARWSASRRTLMREKSNKCRGDGGAAGVD